MNTENDRSWKDRLYKSYVSSGQVRSADAPPNRFFSTSAPYFTDLINRYLPADHHARVMDLGCGHGTCLYFLKCAGYGNVVGIDLSAEQIQQAHRLGIAEAQQGNINTFLQRTTSGSTDVVFLFDVLEHLTRDELFGTLDEVYRVLKAGGKCIVHVPNGEGIYGMRIRYGDLTHEQAFTPQSLNQLFSTVGFRNLQWAEDKPIPHGLKSWVRSLLWEIGTVPHRILLMAETGQTRFALSQNILAIASK